MSEEQEAQAFKELMEHPWVEPALQNMQPTPVPTNIKIEPCEVETEDKTLDFGLLTIVMPTGLTTIYVSPSLIATLVNQCMAVLGAIENKHAGDLVVANKNTEAQVVRDLKLFTEQERNARGRG